MNHRHRIPIISLLALTALALAYIAGMPSDAEAPTPGSDLPLDVEELDVEFVAELIEDNRVQIMDVRTAEEIEESSLPGAIWLPLSELETREPTLTAHPELQPDVPVVVYCRSGVRSLTAARTLRRAGFSRSYSLSGGIQAWSNAGYTLYIGEFPD